ncbi:MAG: hypothetical protein K2H37_10265 [Lachnospiraceae bacterium]|nr:hypothetical protein [Lachnospiraceae bacterium]
MYKRVWSFILTVGLLLALTSDPVMAATSERTSVIIQKTSAPKDQTAPAASEYPPETTKKQTAAPVAVPSDLEGSGTVTDPYRIKDASQLRRFADAVNGIGGAPNTGICAVLTQNIDLSGVCGADTGSWTPIGSSANPYKGTFDGGSFAVSGLYCQKPGASYAGLFATNAGAIKNLGVAGGSVSAGSYAGGLCGINKGTITGCYSTASVSGDKYAGGICGSNDNGATVSVCYNTGAVSGGKYVGGICGYNKNTTSDCYNTGAVTGTGTSIGGICGYNKKLLSGCYNTGEVSGGTGHVGSICGYNHSGSTFLNCYYLITGTEKGNYGVGMTQQQFASGEVCWALNEGNGGSVVWKQTCGSGLPGFGGKAVYRTQSNKSDGSTVFAYTNDSNKKAVTYAAPAPYTTPATTGSSGESTGDNSDGHTHVYQEPKWDWKKYESAKAVLTCQDCGEEFVLKASIKKEVTEPTCTEDGETVYKASVEKDGITFKDKKVVEKERTGHKKPLTKIAENANSTCEMPICKKECWTCPACGKLFDSEEGKKELTKTQVGYKEPLKHTYQGPTWDWQENIATAIFSCQKCPKKTPVAATVKRTQTTLAPTCDKTGTCVYTATVNFQKNSYTDNHDGELPAKGHSLKLDPNGPDGPQYKCTRDGCTYTKSLNGTPGTTTGTTTKEDASKPNSNFENETLTPNEAISGDEEPTLPPDPEETPETPTPPDGSDNADEPGTPDIPDGSDSAETPNVPGGSGNTGEPDTPDTPGNTEEPNAPDASGGTETPDDPDSADELDLPGVPDVPGTTDELNKPDTMEDSTASYGLLNSEGEVADAIEGRSVALHTASAKNDAVQTAGEQQGIPLWGLAIVLTLLTGVVLLIVLREKHN